MVMLMTVLISIANLTLTRVTWEEGTSPEELHPSYWSVGNYLGHFQWI